MSGGRYPTEQYALDKRQTPPIQLQDKCYRCGDNRLQHASKFPYDHEFEEQQ